MRLRALGPCSLLIAAVSAVACHGQTTVNWTGGGANNNWTTVGNWSSGALPTGAFDEIAVIGNGGTAVVSSDFAAISPPDGPPGALLVNNGSKLQVQGVGKFLTDDSGPNVDGSAAFTQGGVLSISGGTATFKSAGLNFSGGGVYAPNITGASHGLISVNGNLALGGGTLRPSFGFSPALPQSWVLADATQITGSFAVDTSAANLSFGKRLETNVLAGGVNGQLLRLDLKAVLGLTVNADTGAASISSPTGTSITMTGYGVTSALGALNPAGWSTLTSQLGGGWNVAGTPSASHLDELGGPIPPANTTRASLTLAATPRSIGSPYNPNALPFGVAPSAAFEYVTSTGAVVNGDVQFTGLNAVNNLLLTVDPATGQGRLTNSSRTTISLRGYSILSDSGALKPANGSWNSLQDQGRTGVEEANATANHLSELVPQVANSVTLTPGQAISLGNLFNTSGAHDLQLEFEFTKPVAGDFNSDGVVNPSDLATWKSQFGASLNGADFLTWQRNLGATSSSAVPAILAGVVKYEALAATTISASVPEPGSAAMMLVVAAAFASVRRRSVVTLAVPACQ